MEATKVELVDDIWIYIFNFLSLYEKAKLSQISKRLQSILANPSTWPVIEIEITKKSSPPFHERLFWNFFARCCTSVVDLNLTVQYSSIQKYISQPNHLPASMIMNHIFSIKTLRRLKIDMSVMKKLDSFKLTKQPACQDLRLLNLEEFVPFADNETEALVFSGLPNLEELYLPQVKNISNLSHLKKLKRLKIAQSTSHEQIIDQIPSLKYLLCDQITANANDVFSKYVSKYRETLIVNGAVFERLFELSLDQVKLLAPLITPYNSNKPYLTSLMEQIFYNEEILEYLVKEVGLDVNGEDFLKYQYRPPCTGANDYKSYVIPTFSYPIAPTIISGAISKFSKLVELGAKPDPGQKSLLSHVATLPLLLKMLELGADPNLPVDDAGTPAFMALISSMPDSTDLISALIKANVDINYEDPKTNQTLLERAIVFKRNEAVNALLAAGAKIAKQCVTPLLTNMPSTLFAELLKSQRISPGMITMNDAVIAIHEGLAPDLAEYFKQNRDVRDENGLTLLHRAVLITSNIKKKRPLIEGLNRPEFTNYQLIGSSFVKKPSNYASEIQSYSSPLQLPQTAVLPLANSKFVFASTTPLQPVADVPGFNFSNVPLELPSFSFSKPNKSDDTKSSAIKSSGFTFSGIPLELPSVGSPTAVNETKSGTTPKSSGFSFNTNRPLELPSLSFSEPNKSVNSPASTASSLGGFEFATGPLSFGEKKSVETKLDTTTTPSSATFGTSNTDAQQLPLSFGNPSKFTFSFGDSQLVSSPSFDSLTHSKNSASQQQPKPRPTIVAGVSPAPSGSLRGIRHWLDNFDSLIELLKIDVDVRASFGETLLLLACKAKVDQSAKLKYVQSLLHHGADPNACDNNKWTPLHAACYLSEWPVVFELLKYGANINAQDSLGITPLMAALYGFKHNLEFLCNEFEDYFAKVLTEYSVDFSLTEKTTKRTLLHLLCCVAGPDIVVPFAKHMNVNARDASGFTPLHYAILFANDQLLEPLIKCGADVNAQTTSLKLTPLMLFLSLFLPSPYGSCLANYSTLLRSRFSSTTVEVPSSWPRMQKPEFINPPWYSTTPYPWWPATAKCGVVIDILLPKSDLTLKDVANNNVLHLLATCDTYYHTYLAKFPELSQLLSQSNDDKLLPDIHQPIFDLNTQPEEVDSLVACVRRILEDARRACKSDLHERFNELLARTDVNYERDPHGNTALHIACQFFHLGVLDSQHGKLDNEREARVFCWYAFKLLDAGADPTIGNNKAETALDFVPELLEYCKDIYPTLNGNNEPIFFALCNSV